MIATFREWLLRFWVTISGRERGMEEELRFHLEMAQQAAVRRGESARQARVILGGLVQASESVRDQDTIVLLSDFLRDVRHAVRLLARSPLITAAAIASLALGIGANTAIFSVADALLLRTLPVPKPQELVVFERIETHGLVYSFSYPWFLKLKQQPGVFSEIAASWVIDRYASVAAGDLTEEPEKLSVCIASGNYFATLGVPAIRGRVLSPEDDRFPGGHPVAVISYGYWSRRFHNAPEAVGQLLTLNQTAYTIAGITPRNFSGEWVGRPVDIWVSYAMASQVMPEVPGGPERFPGVIIGRLKPEVTIRQAEVVSRIIWRQIVYAGVGPNATAQHLRFLASHRLQLESAATGYSERRKGLRMPVWILMAIAGLVLLIACANLANLMLARSVARQREIAIRTAIGAGRGRLTRQWMTEAMVLATAAGACGLLLAAWAGRILMTMMAAGTVSVSAEFGRAPMALDVRLDGRVFAFTLLVSFLTCILFGLAPAILASRLSLTPALTARTAAGVGLRKTLVVFQVALTIVLLCSAGLLLRTLRNLQTQDLGFSRDNVLLVWTSPVQTGRNGPALLSLVEQIRQRIAGLPAVRSVSVSNGGVLEGGQDGGGPSEETAFEDLPPKPGLTLRYYAVTPGFFASTGLPLLQGRDFNAQDTESAPLVAIMGEGLARFVFGRENPIGRRFGGATGRQIEIVGVAKEARAGTARDNRGIWYVPYRQSAHVLRLPWCIAVRTEGAPTAFAARIREELRRIDAGLPILRVNTIEAQLSGALAEDRMLAAISGVFGLIAVMIASIGLYGVVSYAASRRTNEIGVRLALGATRGSVLRMILSESLALVGAGLLAGVPMSLAVTLLISSRLFGVRPADPLTIGAAVMLILIIGTWACLVPARRFSKVDPMVALRYE